MDQIISMFIDNELGLTDKVKFVNKIHADSAFKDLTLDFLEQEQLLRSNVVDRVPMVKVSAKKPFFIPFWRPIAVMTSALAAILILLFFPSPSEITSQTPYRFIIHRPDANHAEITGSFTEWQTFPMKRTGDSGYWEITLDIPEGEHRFIYILDGKQRLPDPTLPRREQDDFGGENSILSI